MLGKKTSPKSTPNTLQTRNFDVRNCISVLTTTITEIITAISKDESSNSKESEINSKKHMDNSNISNPYVYLIGFINAWIRLNLSFALLIIAVGTLLALILTM